MLPPVQIFAPSHIGDAVLALGAMRRLTGRGLRVVVVAREPVAKLLTGQGDWVVRATPERGGTAVLLAPSFRSAWRALRAGCRSRVGRPTDGRRFLLTHAVGAGPMPRTRAPRMLPREHQAAAYHRIVDSALNTTRGARVPDGAFRVSAHAIGCAEQVLDALGPVAVVAHPCAAGPLKAGSERGWVVRLSELDRVLVTGGPGDGPRARRIAERVGARAAAGEQSLPLDVWAALAQRVGRVIAPDTGVAHLAAAVGADTTVFYGPTDPRLHRPVGAATVVGPPPMACAPCYRRTCLHGPEARCLEAPPGSGAAAA